MKQKQQKKGGGWLSDFFNRTMTASDNNTDATANNTTATANNTTATADQDQDQNEKKEASGNPINNNSLWGGKKQRKSKKQNKSKKQRKSKSRKQ
jgi:hypothetical protein